MKEIRIKCMYVTDTIHYVGIREVSYVKEFTTKFK